MKVIKFTELCTVEGFTDKVEQGIREVYIPVEKVISIPRGDWADLTYDVSDIVKENNDFDGSFLYSYIISYEVVEV